MDPVTLDLDEGGEMIVCTKCGLSKPPEAFHVVRGPMAVGDWRAQPCADCCRRRVTRSWTDTAVEAGPDLERQQVN